MPGLTDYLENALVAHYLGKTTYTKPAATYVALFTTAPTDAGGGVEVTGGAYVRMIITATMSTPTVGSSANTGEVAFPAATAAWGTVIAAAIMDASVGGNMLAWNSLATPRAMAVNDVFRFAVGSILVALD